MNTGHLKLFLGGRVHLPFPRTVFQFFRAMANSNPGSWQPQRKVKHKEPLRRVKCKESRSQRTDLNGPSTVYLQVLGAGSRDNPASIYVFSEFNRSAENPKLCQTSLLTPGYVNVASGGRAAGFVLTVAMGTINR